MTVALLAALTFAATWWLVRPLPRRQAVPAALLFFIGGLGLYLWLGSPQLPRMLAEYRAREAAMASEIAALERAAREQPETLEHWVKLAEAHNSLQRYGLAAEAYKKAVLLSGGEPNVIFAYARALILSEGGRITPEAKKSLEMVLLQWPGHPESRYFLALERQQAGDKAGAEKEFKALARELPEEHPLHAMIKERRAK